MLLQSITKWLHKQLGIHIDVIPERFIEIAKDGTLLGQVLQNYNVIEPEELQLLEETCNPAQAYDNYTKYLKPWLERIHMDLNDGDIYEITHGDGTAALTMFYELYQKLESVRSSISFIKRAKKHSFQVEKVVLERKEDEHIETNPLCEPLLKQWDVIRWERDHLASIMIKYVRSREDYDAYLENKKKVEERSFDKKIDGMDEEALGMLKRDKTNYTYEQLIEQQKKASEMAQFEPNSDEAKKIMKEIKRKKKKRAERNAFRIQLQNELLAEVWKKIQQSEEDEFDKTVCEKLLKQSQHEKEIAEKLLQIRQQKEVIIERCRKQAEINEKQKEEEFVRRLFEEDLEERLQYHEERKALLAEHKRLYEEKLRLKALKHEKVCKDITKDAIEVALKTAEFKETYGMEPDKYTQRNWATLFTHQQPIPEFTELKEEDKSIEGLEEEIGKRNIQRLDILDEQDLDDYIHFRNLWKIIDESEELMNLMELGMNVLGYIVHKLLLKKYPLPIPQRPSLSPEIEISVCISEMNDLSRLNYLQRLLELRSVKVIQMEDATNFCIQAYEEESKTEYDEPYPGDDEDLKEIAPRRVDSQKTKKKGKGGKKDKKDKKPKKDKDSKKGKKGKKEKGGKKGKKKGKGGSETKTEIVQPTFEEKQAQTPRRFPWEKVVLSNKARLGKIAKAETELGHSLNDNLLVDMFIEYLLSIKDMKGWVLINYPNTYEQASLLEQALTGKAAPKDYYDTILNKESLTSVQVEEESIITNTESAIETQNPEGHEILISIEDLTEARNETTSVHSPIEIINEKEPRIKSTENVKIKTPEERIANLLPDLKKLAYSDDDNEDTQQTNIKSRASSLKKSHPSRCTCICNKGSRKSSTQEEMIYFVKETASELSQKHEIHEKHHRMSITEQQVKIKTAEEKIMKRLNQEDEENQYDHEEDVLNAMLIGDDSITERSIIREDSNTEKIVKEDSTTEKRINDKRTSEERRYSFENKISTLTAKVSSVRFSNCQQTHPIATSSDPEEQITELDYEGMVKEISEINMQLECTCYLSSTDKEKENIENQIEDPTKEEPTNIEETASMLDKPIEHVVVEDTNEQTRLSKIVPNPRPIEKQIYNTILTAYIKITSREDDTEDEEEYASPVFKELEKKDGLVKFYCDQGCYYVLEYLEFNAETIKCLAKMIIGDYSLPLKSSIEIFGERYKEATFEVGDHKITKKGKPGKKDKKKKNKKKEKKKSKSDTKASKNKKGAKDKKSKGSKSTKSSKSGKGKKNKKDKKKKQEQDKVDIEIGHEDKEVQFPMIEEEEEELLPEPKAGEPDWEYVDLPIPEEIMLSLAMLWEDTENNYIKNFKDLFYNNRVLLSDIVPFLAKTRDVMTKFIRRSDNKQYYLREFQKILNEIDLDMRSDQATKSELYCRIDEFREKLLGMCDTKMRASEEERKNFITKNWLFRQFCEMTNNTIIAFQLEIDRFIDSLQVISDYYISVITKSVNEGYEFHKEMLSKYTCNEDASENFNSLFIEIPNDHVSTEFHDYIDKTHQITSDFVQSMKPLAFKPIDAMKKLFEKEVVEKKPKWKKKSLKQQVKKFEPDEDVKENEERIFEEWECAINGEISRIQIHLDVTKNEAFNRFNDAIEWIKKIFEEIYESISIWYENELSSVHRACEILMQSVEEETIIQQELAFEDDHLVGVRISLDTILPEEEYKDGKFRLEQLSFMVNVLIDLARSGYILKKTFMLLIQDMLYQDDIEETTDTPTLWRNLSIKVLSALLKKLFDDEQYVYWKDFIVVNLMIPFPTREELMNVRRQFREYDPFLTETVRVDDFYNVRFWFEDKEGINLHLLKSIILKMYQTDTDAFNYTDMLLDFCKDEDSILGFVKALELCLGKFICCEEKMGQEYVDTVLENRKKHEEEVKEHDESIILAKRAISLLVDKAIDDVEGEGGLTITEVFEEPPHEEPQPEPELADDEEGKIMVDHKFSYTQIGCEARDDTEMAHFLPLELVLIVIRTVLTWNAKVKKIESDSFQDEIIRIYEECRNEKFNNVVLCHEFLNCEKLKKLFATTTKFSTHNPVKLVKQIIHDDKPEIAEDVEGNSQKELELSEMQ